MQSTLATHVSKPTHLALTLAGLTLVGVVGLTGCGQTDFFSVQVTIDPTISPGTLQLINRCEVMTSGAVSDELDFDLNSSTCGPNTSYMNLEKDSNGDHVLGTFEYGTTKTSGTVTFKILLEDGSAQTIGQGQADGKVGSGIVPVTLKVTDVSGLKG